MLLGRPPVLNTRGPPGLFLDPQNFPQSFRALSQKGHGGFLSHPLILQVKSPNDPSVAPGWGLCGIHAITWGTSHLNHKQGSQERPTPQTQGNTSAVILHMREHCRLCYSVSCELFPERGRGGASPETLTPSVLHSLVSLRTTGQAKPAAPFGN